jgi:hypothetical protein
MMPPSVPPEGAEGGNGEFEGKPPQAMNGRQRSEKFIRFSWVNLAIANLIC